MGLFALLDRSRYVVGQAQTMVGEEERFGRREAREARQPLLRSCDPKGSDRGALV